MQNLLEIQNALRSAPDQQLMSLMQGANSSVPQWAVASEMNSRKEMRDEQTRQEGLGQPTVLQQLTGTAPAPTPQTNVAGMPQGVASGMAQSMAPKTDVAQNTGIASVAPVATMASGGILKMAPGGAVNQVIVTFAEDSPIYPGETRRMTQDTLEAMPRNSVQDVKGVADVGGVEAAKKVPYLPMSGGLKRQLKTIESESFPLIDTSNRNNVPPDNYGVSANLPPAGGVMSSDPAGGTGGNTDSSRLGLPKDEFSQVPVSSMSTPVGLATLAAAGDADVRGETPVVNTSTLSEKELRKQADNRNEAGRARFELMKALEATNSKGQPGGTLGKRYAESDDDLRMVDAQRYIESLIKGDPYSGELSPSQTARNQKTLSDTLRREEMQRQRDAIERQGMESQEEIARENARGNALAALGEIDRSSEPALFRQIASIAGERQANALRADPAMFGDMPFNATSDEAAKKSVSQATLANIDRDKRVAKGSDDLTIPAQLRADEPGTELAVAAKTDPMQMTDTEIRNASQGLIPYDMSMAADGAQDPKPTDDLQAKAVTDVAKVTANENYPVSPVEVRKRLRAMEEKDAGADERFDLAETRLDAERAAGLTAGEDAFVAPSKSPETFATNRVNPFAFNSAKQNEVAPKEFSGVGNYNQGLANQSVGSEEGIATVSPSKSMLERAANFSTAVGTISKDPMGFLAELKNAAAAEKDPALAEALNSQATMLDGLIRTGQSVDNAVGDGLALLNRTGVLLTDLVNKGVIAPINPEAAAYVSENIIGPAGELSNKLATEGVSSLIQSTNNVNALPSIYKDSPVESMTAFNEAAVTAATDGAGDLYNTIITNPGGTKPLPKKVTAPIVTPITTPTDADDLLKELQEKGQGTSPFTANVPAVVDTSQGTGGGIATINPMDNRASDSPSSYEQKLLDILDKREKSADQDKWLGLAEMGMRLMASSNPNMLSAIGEAGLGASQTFLGNKQKAEAQEMDVLSKLSALEARKQIADDANRTRLTAAGISASSKPPRGPASSVLTSLDKDVKLLEERRPPTPKPGSSSIDAQAYESWEKAYSAAIAKRDAYRGDSSLFTGVSGVSNDIPFNAK